MVCRQKVMKRIGSGLEGRGQQVKIIPLLMMMTILMMVIVTVMIMVMTTVTVIIVVVVIFIMRTAGWAPSLCGRGHRLRLR